MSPESNRHMRRLLPIALFVCACGGNDQGRPPPADQLFFPTGLVVDPAGQWAYVTNGNTDLRYSGGSIVAIPLSSADGKGVLDRFLNGDAACKGQDPIDNRIPMCDQTAVIDKAKTVQLGSFPGQPAVQTFYQVQGGHCRGNPTLTCDPNDAASCPTRCLSGAPTPCQAPDTPVPACVADLVPDPGQGVRLLVPVRGDPSLTWIHVGTDGAMDCGQGGAPLGKCDTAHRLTTLLSNPTTLFAPEPFGLAVDDKMGVAMTAHLSSAAVALFWLGDTNTNDPSLGPQLVDQRTGVFDPNASGVRGAYGMAIRPIDPLQLPAFCEGLGGGRCTLGDYTQFYATSRVTARVEQLEARGADLCTPHLPGDPCASVQQLSLVGGPQIALDSFLIDGADVRDIKFNADGTRAYVVDRQPPSLLMIDTSPEPPPAGNPMNQILGAVELCEDPSLITVRETPGPLRVYVSCFSAGQIYVIDPERGDTVDTIDVGRGPNAVTLLPPRMLDIPSCDGTATVQHLLAMVTNFSDNDIAVLDLTPENRCEDTVLFKIGALEGQ